jgi:hypothetical protein
MKKDKTTFQSILEDLTPEQKRELREATTPEWAKAIHSVITDPAFWSDMSIAFIEGLAQGLAEAITDDRK